MTALVVGAMTVGACAPVAPGAPAAGAGAPALDCAGWLGDPAPGTAEWDRADLNNRQCAAEGQRITQNNPGVGAATWANYSEGQWLFQGDPFRAPHRWDGERGTYELATYKDRNGVQWGAALFGPRDAGAGPHPGVVLACHACPLFPTTEGISMWYWAAQALAEAGYVVMYASIAGNSAPTTVDATDWFVATPEHPTVQGEFNPWHEWLDRSRLGITGHSGAAWVALNVGHSDPRFDAVVAWDPAPIGFLEEGTTPRVPTMVQAADYGLFEQPPARPERPTPEPGSKYTYFDTIRDAGVDAMQVVPRASTHLDWTRFPPYVGPNGVYGEMVATYYTLAWFDRYLVPSRADDARRRLTATGDRPVDRSADVHSIGAGFFDPARAERAGNDEAGNVPVEIGGIPVRNLLSFHYPSRYFLDRGALRCDDMRAGCPQPE